MSDLIVVLMGGLSGERKISFLSGKACAKALRKKKYKVKELDAKGYFVDKLRKLKPKIVFNALHGKYGEDGLVQSILESLKIPYTHSGIFASSLAMDKELSRLIFKKNNIKVPKYFLLQKDYEGNFEKKIKSKKIKFPIVIKPINEGSSLGVYICENKIEFKEVLAYGDDKKMEVGSPLVKGAKVEAELVKNGKNRTVLIFKKRRRKNSRRKNGHRQLYSLIKIKKIFSKDGSVLAEAKKVEKKEIKKIEKKETKAKVK